MTTIPRYYATQLIERDVQGQQVLVKDPESIRRFTSLPERQRWVEAGALRIKCGYRFWAQQQ